MKYIVIILLLTASLFTPDNSSAQHKIIEPEIEKLWYVTYFSCHYLYIGQCSTTDIFSIEDETMVGDTLYSEVYKASNEDLSDSVLIGYLREENNKVFFLPLSERPEYSTLPEGKEYLIYDFSLEESDTIWVTSTMFSGDTYQYTVADVDSIVINGVKHKRITLNDGSIQEIWIEGIGSLQGLVYSCLRVSCSIRHLTCQIVNGQTLYTNPDYNFCYCDTASGTEQIFDKFILYPNPAKGTINIEGASKSVFCLYNSLGNLVFEKDIDETTNIIDISNQANGVYLYKISVGDSYKASKIIILNK